jgi:hypothetical protein
METSRLGRPLTSDEMYAIQNPLDVSVMLKEFKSGNATNACHYSDTKTWSGWEITEEVDEETPF